MVRLGFKKQLLVLSAFAVTMSTFVACNGLNLSNDSINHPELPDTSYDNITTAIPEYVISSKDVPVGYGNKTVKMQTGEGVTVSTKEELVAALNNGGLIYINGMIDLSEGHMPFVAGGSTPALDAFVKTISNGEFETYEEYKVAYAANCTAATNDKSRKATESKYGTLMWALNDKYKEMIRPYLKSNTTIIGLTEESGVYGGTFIINGPDNTPIENVVLRNLVIRDAYDPFPHHEEYDGFNSQHDTICIQDGSHDIWIDHCTFYDTLGVGYVKIADGSEEKYQTYDGLLDMKSKKTTNITVSYCKFMNHDKTMLIGSSDTELSATDPVRYVTLHHNLFINCGQRLPMVRQTSLHAFNNVYLVNNPKYKSQYAFGVRKDAKIFSMYNYFGTGVLYSYSGIADESKQGTVCAVGDIDNSINKQKEGNFKTADSSPFFVEGYRYSKALDKENVLEIVKKNAGAGKITLED